jgi:hypothetical protein
MEGIEALPFRVFCEPHQPRLPQLGFSVDRDGNAADLSGCG